MVSAALVILQVAACTLPGGTDNTPTAEPTTVPTPGPTAVPTAVPTAGPTIPAGLPIEIVSVNGSGTEGNYDSRMPSISADDRYVAFYSSASNLVPGDTNSTYDIFIYDRQLSSIERISVDGSGTQGNNLSSTPSISEDGRYVAFHSFASNLVTGDTNGTYDVFVYDRQLNSIERVSVNESGIEGNAASMYPAISADGHYVAFSSSASNFVTGDTNGRYDIFVAPVQ